jgi:ubiquinone/menaquinone biosynthesis C-methylase UbiE
MRTYYTGKHAVHYNRTWRFFLQKTLAATLAAIDAASLQQRAKTSDRPLRILDAACGTGLLLEQLSHLFPHAELEGVDASQDMLDQAARLLRDRAGVHLVLAVLGGGETAGLPYPPACFDLLTCTNTLHYFTDPAATLGGFKRLLAPGGQMVIEDYILRGSPSLWRPFERLIRVVDPQHRHLYTLEEAEALCQRVGISVVETRSFPISHICKGWVLRCYGEI